MVSNIPATRNKNFQYLANEITMKISGIGEQKIISSDDIICPDTIYINGQQITINQINCRNIDLNTFYTSNNTIIISWNESLDDIHEMFANLTNII